MSATLAVEGIGTDLLLVIACAGLVPLILGKLKVALIPGYLIAGFIIGPIFGLISEPDHIADIAAIASVLLMFTIGLHLDFRSMRSAVGSIVAVGVGSTVVSAIVLASIALAFGVPWQGAVALGLALAMSSTAAVLKLLQERRDMNRPHGRLAFGVLIMQDLAVVAVLAVIPLLAESSVGEHAFGFGQAALQLLVVALLILVGRFGLTRMMELAMRVGGSELVLVIGAGAALGAAVASTSVGLSGELGAFVAGLVLAASPVRHQLSGQLAPLRDLFMALFFTAVGLRVSPGDIGGSWWVLLITLPLLMVVKSVVISVSSWFAGASPAVAVRTGLILSQAGEFSLIVLVLIAEVNLVDDRVGALVTATVFLSLLLTPAMMGVSSRIGNLGGWGIMAPWIGKAYFVERPAAPGEEEGVRVACPVIIAGFGPMGRACAERLEKHQLKYTIIEMNARTVKTQTRLGRSIVYGDATNPIVLESAGILDASAIILTIPDETAMLRACRVVRQLNPDIYIVARAGMLSQANLATELGADKVLVDEIAAARGMAGEVVKQLSRLGHVSAEDLALK